MSGFKLIAIRPLVGCDSRFLKNLEASEIYKFYNDFEFKLDNYGKDVISIQNNSSVPDNLFGENISVSAIVGKNGSGKSALIELFVACVNQFSYYLNTIEFNNKKQIITDADLESIEFTGSSKGINAELYFLKDKQYFNLKIYNNNFKSLSNISKRIEIEKDKLKSFFYTLIINYSIYSFNPHVLGKQLSFRKSHNHWIDGLFHKNDSYQIPLVINPKRESARWNYGGVIDINNEQNLLQQRLLNNILKYYSYGFVDHLKITENRKAVTIIKENKPYFELNTYKAINQNDIKVEEKDIKDKKAEVFWQKSFNNPLSYGIQIKNNNIDGKPKTYWQYDQVILKTLLKFRIKEKQNPFIGKCYEYIVYKVFSICEKYPDYKIFLKDADVDPFKITINIDEFLNYISELKIRSHITNKLLQVINFIKYYDKIWFKYVDEENINILTLAKELNTLVSRERPLIELLPPAIFSLKIEVEEIINDKYQGNKITVDKLSSGEQQLIHATSTILYHLNNIKSVKNTRLITKYDSVNLIFDEIELYFHPEYQRQLLENILKGIKNNKLDTLKINVLFVTHSPFILSDIPSQNILKLEDGKTIESEVSENTFGANIHDLLANDFFLKKGFMGEFAKNEITNVIESLSIICLNKELKEKKELHLKFKKDGKDIKIINSEIRKINSKLVDVRILDKKYDKEYCKKIIGIVGEPMLASSLMELFIEAYPLEKEDFIQSQIDRLIKLKSV